MTLAFAADASEPVSGALTFLLTQGVLGVLCVLLIGALVYQTKKADKIQESRIEDQKLYADTLGTVNTAVRELSVELNKSSAGMVSDVRSTLQEVTSKTGLLEKTVEKLDQSVDALKDEQVRLGAGLGGRK